MQAHSTCPDYSEQVLEGTIDARSNDRTPFTSIPNSVLPHLELWQGRGWTLGVNVFMALCRYSFGGKRELTAKKLNDYVLTEQEKNWPKRAGTPPGLGSKRRVQIWINLIELSGLARRVWVYEGARKRGWHILIRGQGHEQWDPHIDTFEYLDAWEHEAKRQAEVKAAKEQGDPPPPPQPRPCADSRRIKLTRTRFTVTVEELQADEKLEPNELRADEKLELKEELKPRPLVHNDGSRWSQGAVSNLHRLWNDELRRTGRGLRGVTESEMVQALDMVQKWSGVDPPQCIAYLQAAARNHVIFDGTKFPLWVAASSTSGPGYFETWRPKKCQRRIPKPIEEVGERVTADQINAAVKKLRLHLA